MTFRRTDAKTVTHDDGYVVREAFPRYAEYREGDHVLRFGAEMTGPRSPYAIILHGHTPPPRWQPPFEGEALNTERLRTIIERVTAGLHALGIRPQWGYQAALDGAADEATRGAVQSIANERGRARRAPTAEGPPSAGRPRLGPTLLAAIAYLAAILLFGGLARVAAEGATRTAWRLGAFVASGLVFLVHLRHEQMRVATSARRVASHVALAVAIGVLLVAAVGPVRAYGVGSRQGALALVLWPLLTALPAFVAAWMLAALARRHGAHRSAHEGGNES